MKDIIFFRSAEQVIKDALKTVKAKDIKDFHETRNNAVAYYQYRGTDKLIEPYFTEKFRAELPLYTNNITKRIINRISLVNKTAPKYNVDSDVYVDMIENKPQAMKLFERMGTLIGTVALKIGLKNGKFTYRLIREYDPFFDVDDVIHPIGLTYAIQHPTSSDRQTRDDIFVYWDEDTHFMYDTSGRHLKIEGNEQEINPYDGLVPVVYLQPDTALDEHWNLGAIDIPEANRNIDVAMTMLNHHIKTAGGQWVGTGDIDIKKIAMGLYKMPIVPENADIKNIGNQVKISEIVEGIKYQLTMVQGNHHLKFDYGFTGNMSGAALRIENIELLEDREDSVDQFRSLYKQIYKIERAIAAVPPPGETPVILPEEFGVNFDEVDFPDPEREQANWDWKFKNGLADKVDWLMASDPDGFPDRETAQAYLDERKPVPVQGSGLLSALRKPVE